MQNIKQQVEAARKETMQTETWDNGTSHSLSWVVPGVGTGGYQGGHQVYIGQHGKNTYDYYDYDNGGVFYETVEIIYFTVGKWDSSSWGK